LASDVEYPILGHRAGELRRILVISDARASASRMASELAGNAAAREVERLSASRFAVEGAALIERLEATPDLVVLDAAVEGDEGELVRRLAATPRLRGAPVVLVGRGDSESEELLGFASGVAGFVPRSLLERPSALADEVRRVWREMRADQGN
jgi:CheY-like chemotaxis protein